MSQLGPDDIPNIWKVIKLMFQTTNHQKSHSPLDPLPSLQLIHAILLTTLSLLLPIFRSPDEPCSKNTICFKNSIYITLGPCNL
jgi:hypothetical protein